MCLIQSDRKTIKNEIFYQPTSGQVHSVFFRYKGTSTRRRSVRMDLINELIITLKLLERKKI